MAVYTATAAVTVTEPVPSAESVAAITSATLNSAFVRVVRPVSDILGRLRVEMRDPVGRRWTDAEIYNAINRALDTWSSRVYIPCLYDIAADLQSDVIEYAIPYYIRSPFMLERKVERWEWVSQSDNESWSSVEGAKAIPDGSGGQLLWVEAGSSWLTQQDIRIRWEAEVGHIPTAPVVSIGTITDDDVSLVVDAEIFDTVGDVGFVKMDEEIMQYSGVSQSSSSITLLGLIRGCSGSTAATHAAGTTVEWCIPYDVASLYNVLSVQTKSYMQEFPMTDASEKETAHHQWLMRWYQQTADDFWTTWLPNRQPQFRLSKQAVANRRY